MLLLSLLSGNYINISIYLVYYKWQMYSQNQPSPQLPCLLLPDCLSLVFHCELDLYWVHSIHARSEVNYHLLCNCPHVHAGIEQSHQAIVDSALRLMFAQMCLW